MIFPQLCCERKFSTRNEQDVYMYCIEGLTMLFAVAPETVQLRPNKLDIQFLVPARATLQPAACLVRIRIN